MTNIALSGNDTITINNRVISDFADQKIGELSFPNEIIAVKTGKNGNAIYALNTTGLQCNLTLRIIRGSPDDKFFNGLLNTQLNNTSTFPLMIGTFVKVLGQGDGNVVTDTYAMTGGIFTNQVEAQSDVEGDIEQSVAVYKFRWSNAPRLIA